MGIKALNKIYAQIQKHKKYILIIRARVFVCIHVKFANRDSVVGIVLARIHVNKEFIGTEEF